MKRTGKLFYKFKLVTYLEATVEFFASTILVRAVHGLVIGQPHSLYSIGPEVVVGLVNGQRAGMVISNGSSGPGSRVVSSFNKGQPGTEAKVMNEKKAECQVEIEIETNLNLSLIGILSFELGKGLLW